MKTHNTHSECVPETVYMIKFHIICIVVSKCRGGWSCPESISINAMYKKYLFGKGKIVVRTMEEVLTTIAVT